VDTEAAQPAEELRKLGGARVILATAPSSQAISEVINGLGNEGQLYLLAMQNEPVQVSPLQLARGGRSIRGSMGRFVSGSVEDTLSFSVLTGVRPMIETFSLDQASEAYEKMMSARVHFRSVLVPETSVAGA
jgi:D-arabinose 1-dehydrogenase-like Zn-dependent alcohol dehydrogenase